MKTDFIPSVMYNYVRGRQLEGTYPGDQKTGYWSITALRIFKGWGIPSENDWPLNCDTWPPKEPPNIDIIANNKHISTYARIRSITECKYFLGVLGKLVLVTFEINIQDWSNPNDNTINDSNGTNNAMHSVVLVGYNDNNRLFEIRNSWGTSWGNKGYAYASYDYIEKHMIEAWGISDTTQIPLSSNKNVNIINYGKEDFGYITHITEIIDPNKSNNIAWAFARNIENYLDVEEFFVKPDERRKGYGQILFNDLALLAKNLNLSLRFWIPFPDVSQNTKILHNFFSNNNFKLTPSIEKWAARQALIKQDIDESS